MPENNISVKVKCSNETAFSVTVDSSSSVGVLKNLIEKHFGDATPTPAGSQRLIFAGKVLKDDESLDSYKLMEGNTGNKPAAPKPAAPVATPPATAAPTVPGASTQMQNPFQMFGQPPANPFGATPGVDPMAGMASNPMFAQMMSQMMQDPQILDQMIASNPQLAGMITPEMRQQMQSPQFRQLMANPQMIQQMLSMAGGMGGMGAGMNPLANMYGQQPGAAFPGMGGMANPFASMFGNQAPAQPAGPVVPPEELYATQLAQLNDMGFYSPQENIRALQMTGGNVEAAVEWLFSHPAGSL